MSGVVAALSPSGTVIRVQMDELGDSYVWAAHVEPRPTDNGRPEAVGLRE
jgi:hypothetical protein